MTNEIEFIMYLLVMIGCAYTSFRLGKHEGVQDAISYFHDMGMIEPKEED
jgi:hypothetical protein